MNTHIIVGCGFGDEGKGLTTSSLVASLKNPLVVRFNGGHQAGHTVVKDGIRHVFSNFGSGTLHGAPTYWSRFCTFDPVGIYNEYMVLKDKGIRPTLFVDPDCPVVTGYDKAFNVSDKRYMNNGTCGVGFGSTLKREADHYHLKVRDLFYPKILRERLTHIADYYSMISDGDKIIDLEDYIQAIITFGFFEIRQLKAWTNQYSDIVFEGAQGIMLDQEYGFFPNVTRSYTTTRNAREIINERGWQEPTVYYITRAYQTRHGNGYMSNDDKPITLKNNENETNVEGIQGKFRTGILDLDLLKYALECDRYVAIPENKKLVITCLDQIEGAELDGFFPVTVGDNQRYKSLESIAAKLNFDPKHELITFNSPITKKLF